MVRFSVPGKPIPAERMTGRGKFVKKRAQDYLSYKDFVGWMAKKAGVKLITGPVGIRVEFYFKNKVHGDIDNLQKSIFDGLNKIAFKDDKQIAEVKARVRYSPDERAEVEIWELEAG